MQSIIRHASEEILIYNEVSYVLRNIVGAIDNQAQQDEHEELLQVATHLREDVGFLLNTINKQKQIESERSEKAKQIRDVLVSDIGRMFRERQNIHLLYEKIDTLEDTMKIIIDERDLYKTQLREEALVANKVPLRESTVGVSHSLREGAENRVPLEKTDINIGMTREVANALTNKLSPEEIKIIANMTERLKRLSFNNELLSAEKDDIMSTLQHTEYIKDLLIDKLRTAEVALKGQMTENKSLMNNSLKDKEIIEYLDIHGQELETKLQNIMENNLKLRFQCDLEIKAVMAMQHKLQMENKDLKEKLQVGKAEKKVLIKEVKELRNHNSQIINRNCQMESKLEQLRNLLFGPSREP